MKKQSKWLSLSLAAMLLLTACTGGTGTGGGTTEVDALPTIVENEGEPIEGGVLKVGMIGSSPFKGMFCAPLYLGADDAMVMQYTMWGAFMLDADFKIRDGGPVSLAVDVENKTSTLTIDEKYTWNDGTPVTAMDFAYYYYIIADPDYTGVRYDDEMRTVVGIEDYHNGTSETISGLEIKDDKTLVVHLTKVSPSNLWGGAIPFEPVPYHQLKDIPVKDLESSDAVRKNPLSAGPYYITEIVSGEKVMFKANEYFWKGKALIPEVMMELVNPDAVVEAIQMGKYDFVLTSFPADKYNEVVNLNNVTVIGRPTYIYDYTGFKLGKWDTANGEVVTDLTMKMGDVNLRKAMGYALDMEAINQQLFNGLRPPANSLIPPLFTNFHTDNPNAISYDKEKAIQILDDAGYKDVDNDGFRENPDGSKLQINVATLARGDLGDSLALFYTQSWQDVGLDTVLTTGRPIEYNSFYDKVQNDDADIDVFMAGWSTGSNPEPSALYGKNALFNYIRFTTPELEQILKDINSEQAFDDAFRNDAYKRFEEYMIEHAPIIPNNYRIEVNVINDRVKYFDWSHPDSEKPYSSWAELQLTAAEPYAHEE